MDADKPLVVDLDGTLTPTDTLVESLIRLIRTRPRDVFKLPIWLLRGRAYLKEMLASRAPVRVDTLPYRGRFLDYLRDQKRKGRRIILATAAHRSIAQRVADHIGIFDQVIATESGRNLKGPAKLQQIRLTVGDQFVYAGDSRADIPIWKSSSAAILVGATTSTTLLIQREKGVEMEFAADALGIIVWPRALRIHQWLKNMLIFVPLLTSFSITDWHQIGASILAFVSFSLAASGTYIINDLFDLENDRSHPKKRLRPFANGDIPIVNGLYASAMILTASLAAASAISSGFTIILLIYLATTIAYTLKIKTYIILDVLVLSALYAIRIIAGAIALSITTSPWLLAFSVFLFLGLALMKRCTELVLLCENNVQSASGRDYRVSDLRILWPLGVGSSICSAVVFCLFVNAPETQSRYHTPELLWLTAIFIVYWLVRMWIKTSRSEMNDDPLVYALMDHGSRRIISVIILSVLTASYVDITGAL